MNKQILIILVVALTGGFHAFADDSSSSSLSLPAASSSSAPLPSSGSSVNSVPGADEVDQVLTNANLRAYSGSKSRWSMSNSINYDGGTVSEPFAEGRPNIADASATTTDTDINDQISLKYSINAMNSLLLGFGVRKIAPFTFSGPSASYYAQGGKDVDMYDPSLTYQYIYKFLGIQSVAQVQFIQFTRQDIHSSNGGNLDREYSFDQENMYEIGNWSIGGSIGFGTNTPTQWGTDFSQFQFWFDPYVEYRLNDTFNLRTVANTWTYEYYPVEKLVHDTYTQSIGVGYSAARDVYLYPNLQFLPGHMAWSQTNVGVSATVNLF